MPVVNRRTGQAFKSSTLNILTLDDEVKQATTTVASSSTTVGPVPSSSPSTSQVPVSFHGFAIKTDDQIRSDAQKRWADLQDTPTNVHYSPLVSSSPFEGINKIKTHRGDFPGEEAAEAVTAAPHDDEQEVQVTPSPSTPTRFEERVEEAPLKPGEEDVDGAEAFEQEEKPQEFSPGRHNNPYSQQPQHPHRHQHYLPPPVQSSGGFVHHHHQDAARQYQRNNHSFPAPPVYQQDQLQLSQELSRPANHELLGFLPFYKFDETVHTELQTAASLGADTIGPHRSPKLFFGHVWSKVPTGVVQWLVNSFGPRGSIAFEPQLHFNKEGWFRGCLHASVETSDPQALIYALHKRVLFDHEGVWFAETADQMRILDDYCKRLRALPLQIRHTKLQSLPCNPLACELARNE